MPVVNSTRYPPGTSNEMRRTSGSAAELKASRAEKATAICWSFPIRYINKQGFNFNFTSPASTGLSQSLPLSYTFILWCSPRRCLIGPILFTIYVSPIASIVSSHGVNQQQYADDAQLFVFLFPSSLSSSLCSLQRCVSFLQRWFIHLGLVLNPTNAEAICFGSSPRLQSLSNLTSMEVAGISVSLVVDCVKLLGVNFDKYISNVCSSSYFHIRALRHFRPFVDSELPRHCLCYCWLQIRLC